MKRKCLKVISFLLLFILLFFNFFNAFNYKYGDGILSIKKFYDEPENSIDVLCFGSSMIFENVNTEILWDNYGIASFDLCGSIQPFWNTYYYMKEALRTQKPKVMVMDVYGAVQKEDYIDYSRIIKNNYGLNFSKDKIQSIITSTPPDEQIDYLLEYPTFHSRYNELTRKDFEKDNGNVLFKNWKGYGMNTATTAFSRPSDFQTSEESKLTKKVEKYLLKIINLSKENNVPLLLVKTPYIISKDDQEIYNTVADIADKNNIPFVNFNNYYDEIGLDFSTDFADTSHMNYHGNEKFTSYLANYLKSNYDIPDHRNDEKYKSYDYMAEDCKQRIYNFEQTQIMDIGHYVDGSINEDYISIFSFFGDYQNMDNYDAVKEKMATIGIDLDSHPEEAVYILRGNNVIYSADNQSVFNWHLEVAKNQTLMVSCNQKDSDISINFNNNNYQAVESGLNILIYDKSTQSLVESVGFPLVKNQLSYKKISENISDKG